MPALSKYRLSGPVMLLSWLSVAGCCRDYVAYAVDNLRGVSQVDRALPLIDSDPVEVTPNYRTFRAPTGGARYQIPDRLQLSLTPQGRIQAASLERRFEPDLILVANLAPPIVVGLNYYPIQRLDIRPITSTPDHKFQVTVIPGAKDTAPFSVIVIIQAFGSETVNALKALLRTGAGFVFDAHFDVMFAGQGVREVTIPVSLDQAGITQETM